LASAGDAEVVRLLAVDVNVGKGALGQERLDELDFLIGGRSWVDAD
jgi:hypothetical protein